MLKKIKLNSIASSINYVRNIIVKVISSPNDRSAPACEEFVFDPKTFLKEKTPSQEELDQFLKIAEELRRDLEKLKEEGVTENYFAHYHEIAHIRICNVDLLFETLRVRFCLDIFKHIAKKIKEKIAVISCEARDFLSYNYSPFPKGVAYPGLIFNDSKEVRNLKIKTRMNSEKKGLFENYRGLRLVF
ncbi:MAG: hypothetical protein GY909_15355 [Oligoflexia bacterium]|nr:hypothetical protein [Oligoflexia bacterium]